MLSLISLTATLLFIYGYIRCWILACEYARYKGYSKVFSWLGILNVFGLSILFLLRNRRLNDTDLSNNNAIENFSISAIFLSYVAIEFLFIPVAFLGAILLFGIEPKSVGDLLSNKDFIAVYSIPIGMVIVWYFFREMRRARVNFKHITGSFKKVDYKLPLGLAIAQYFFADGTSNIILYGLSFVAPKYVEHRVNEISATTTWGYACFAFLVLIFAPIMEELFFRGIIFQKLAIKKNPVKGLVISALLFTVVHFRHDVISLFTVGVTLALLYLKTKQIIVPIICHFFYNLIVLANIIYWQFFDTDGSDVASTVADYQQYFIEHLGLSILYVAISAPLISYFIYKNFPYSYDVDRLPYFANKKIESA